VTDEPTKPATRRRILICEDETILAEDLAFTLTQLGYDVPESVSSAEDAVRAADELKPDLILMDIKLRGQANGIDAVEKIRLRADIPVIYLSAYGGGDVLERAKRTEPYGYLGKPVGTAELRSAVEVALYKHEADKRVRASEEKYRRIFNNIQDVYAETLLDGTIVEVSPSIEKFAKYTRDELIGRSVLDLHVSPEQREALLRVVLAKGSVSDYEAVYRDKNGGLVPASATITTESDDAGAPTRLCGIFRDISERKQAEEALRRSESLLRATQRMAHVGGWEFDVATFDQVWTEETYRIHEVDFDYQPSVKTEIAFYPDSSRPIIRRAIKNVVDKGEPFDVELEFVTAKGNLKWVRVMGEAVQEGGKTVKVIGTFQDITDRRKAEESQREKDRLVHSLAEAMPDLVYIKDPAGRYLHINKQFASCWGVDREEVIGGAIQNFLPTELWQQCEASDQAVISNNAPYTAEESYRDQDGLEICFETRKVPVLDDQDNVVAIVGISRDITERKRAERALKDREDFIRFIGDNLPSSMIYQVVRDADGTRRFTYLSDAVRRFYGCSATDAMNDPGLIYGRVHQEDRERVFRAEENAHETCSDFSAEVRMINPAGNIRWSHFASSQRRLEDGATCWSGIEVDITERKNAEEALKETANKLTLVFENCMEATLITRIQDGTVLELNSAAERVYGWPRSEARGKSVAELGVWRDPSERAKIVTALREHGQVVDEEVQFKRKNGEIIDGSVSACLIDYHGEKVILSNVRDITYRKKVEEDLRKGEEKYRRMFESIQDVYYEALPDGTILDVSPSVERVSGWKREDLIGRSMLDVHANPEQRQKLLEKLFTDGEVNDYEVWARDKTGRLMPCSISARVFLDDLGRPISTCGTLRDITERKQAEQERRERNRLSQILLDRIPCVAMLLRPYSREIVASNEPAAAFGAIPGAKCYSAWVKRSTPCPWCLGPKLWETGEAQQMEIRTNGVVFDAYWIPITPDLYMHYAFDVTERKKSEELARQSDRFRAVADLTAGVAHNFNNLLQIVLGNASLGLMNLQSGDFKELKENLEQVIESSRFGAETVNRLNRYARGPAVSQKEPLEIFDVSDMVKQAVEMTRPWWKTEPEKRGIKISMVSRLKGGCTIRGKKNEVFEVLVNLIRNAVEALPLGGEIEIDAEVKNNAVVVRVADTGIGIPKENLSRLFTPFFTTSVQAGRGLGLATCHRIVDAHGGGVFVESAEGKGSSFTVTLPYVPYEPPQIEAPKTKAPRKSMTILVVDDLEATVNLLGAGLGRLGHTVLGALSGQEALECFDEAHVDLVICDLAMPDMNGWEVGKAIIEICRNKAIAKPPFIILTGWADQAHDQRNISDSGVDAIVQKPVDIAKLIEVILRTPDVCRG
jgi:PAS domain S-box-containing protein